jgi:nucleoside-diphosphate kinase
MRTLLLLKPDIVECGLYPEVISLLMRNRFKIVRMTMLSLDRKTAEEFYEIHKDKAFFPSLIEYITSNPVVAMELEGDNIVEDIRAFIGPTDPSKASPGTIRYMYGSNIQHNAVHASDSPEAAKKEIAIIFDGL